jgi:hypothetical protein
MHTAVNANIISVKVQSTAGGNYFYQSEESTNGTSYGDPLVYGNSQIAEVFGSRADGSAGSFDSVSSIDGDEILFKNGNAAYGAGAFSTSRTVVDIEFQNTGTEAIKPTLKSQILPAGMGLFLSNCSGENLRECQSTTDPGFTFANLDSFSGNAETLMSADFDFKVLLGATELYSLSGGIAVEVDSANNINIVRNISAAESVLNNFRLTSIDGGLQQITYDWGATDFEVIFPDLLDANEIATLSYIIEVSTTTSQSCSSVDTSPCSLAYAAFGDPIGRGGAAGPRTVSRSFSSASFVAQSDPLISGYEAGLYRMAAPTFEGGILTYRANSGPGIAASSVNVPEPSVFALLALGVGFLSLRRKR